MDTLSTFLTNWGYWGMLVAAFLAGSFLPFSSEAVMLALLAAKMDPWKLLLYASLGNIVGSMVNYCIGRMGRLDWIEKYLHVDHEQLNKAIRIMNGRGAWMGFFAFLPIVGSGIAIALGLMRANIYISLTSITIGKVMRYFLIITGASLLFL